MTGRPTRATVEGRAHLDLQNLARRTGPSDELHQIYALETFSPDSPARRTRTGSSSLGGVLLAAYDARRPTRDVDLQGRWISKALTKCSASCERSRGRDLDDGLVFDADGATAELIRDEEIYSGVRVTVAGHLSVARLAFHVEGRPFGPGRS